MSKVDVRALARIARIPIYEETNAGLWTSELEAFASLVLEEAAKVSEDHPHGGTVNIAAAIRALKSVQP